MRIKTIQTAIKRINTDPFGVLGKGSIERTRGVQDQGATKVLLESPRNQGSPQLTQLEATERPMGLSVICLDRFLQEVIG